MASSLVRFWCHRSAQCHRFQLKRHHGSITTSGGKSAPWLMLPPAALEGGNMLYKFYSPSKDQIFPIPMNKLHPDAKFVGSSQGWLALFDEKSNHVFLSNPISRQHMKLPAVDTLPDPDLNLLDGRAQVSRLVLSHSPLEDDCRALLTFGPNDRLAFCAPRAAAVEWTPIGDLYFEDDECIDRISDRSENDRSYEDFVYSSRHHLFFCITELYTEVEAWDLKDPLSPRMDWMFPFSEDLRFSLPFYPWPVQTKKELVFIDKCFHPKYLVFSDHSDDLFVVVRHVVPRLRPDGSAADRIYLFGYAGPWDHRYPYKTIGFDVYKIDRKSGKLEHMEDSLEGLAIFVGMNHSFAVLAAEFGEEVKADSIYFTDEDRRITPKWLARTSFGGHDNGVFYYRDKTISSCCSYYPVEYDKIRRIVPPPMWFIPAYH